LKTSGTNPNISIMVIVKWLGVTELNWCNTFITSVVRNEFICTNIAFVGMEFANITIFNFARFASWLDSFFDVFIEIEPV